MQKGQGCSEKRWSIYGRGWVRRLPVVRPGENGGPVFAVDTTPIPPTFSEQKTGIDWSLLPLLLPEERTAPTLVFGADMSALSSMLAKPGARVIRLDPNYKRLLRQGSPGDQTEEADVFAVCGGDTTCLPLRDGSVGLTIVNQVRHPPNGRVDGDPVRIHAGFLVEARRVLKAGGELCLILSQREGRISPSESRALLRRCGFSTRECYMPLSRHDWFTSLVPIVSGKAMRSCIDVSVEGNASRERCLRAWLKILATLGLLQYLTPEYIVIARKER